MAKLLCVDVDYRADRAVVAAVEADQWTAEKPCAETAIHLPGPSSAYVPGQFYKRELPCILAILELISTPPQIIVVDGYVWLGANKPGLGAVVFEALKAAGQPDPIIVGVAKTAYSTAPSQPVYRGTSQRPLHVTSEGIAATEAAIAVARMAGSHRMPTLLKRADRLARDDL